MMMKWKLGCMWSLFSCFWYWGCRALTSRKRFWIFLKCFAVWSIHVEYSLGVARHSCVLLCWWLLHQLQVFCPLVSFVMMNISCMCTANWIAWWASYKLCRDMMCCLISCSMSWWVAIWYCGGTIDSDSASYSRTAYFVVRELMFSTL